MNETNAMALADSAMNAVDWDALHARSQSVFDAVHRGSSLALQSGLFGVPPDRPDMTRALPNYAEPKTILEQRQAELGVGIGPPPPAFTQSGIQGAANKEGQSIG